MRVAFCGVGALGSTAAVWCRNLDTTLRLIDFDRVESKNLLAQAFVRQSIGKNKATALKLQLANFYGLKAEAFGTRLEATNADELLGKTDLLVDCFDNAASRRLVSDYARRHDTACVHAALSAEGDYGMVRWNDQFSADEEDQPGQPTCEGGQLLPMVGIVAAVLARTIQEYLADGSQRNSMISLSAVQRW